MSLFKRGKLLRFNFTKLDMDNDRQFHKKKKTSFDSENWALTIKLPELRGKQMGALIAHTILHANCDVMPTQVKKIAANTQIFLVSAHGKTIFRSNHTRGQTNSQKGLLDHLDLGRFSDFVKGGSDPAKISAQ